MKRLFYLCIGLSLLCLTCGPSKDDARTRAENFIQFISLLRMSGNFPSDPCEHVRGTSIGSDFSTTGTFFTGSSNEIFILSADPNATHKFSLQTLSANCSAFYIEFDFCKFTKVNRTSYSQECNNTNENNPVKFTQAGPLTGIASVDCSITSVPALTHIRIQTITSIPGGCQWAFQYKKK